MFWVTDSRNEMYVYVYIYIYIYIFPYLQEEALYKYPITTYPDVDDITSALDPFLRLFNVVLKWQKAEKRQFITHFSFI